MLSAPTDPHPEESEDSSEENDGTSTKILNDEFHAFFIPCTQDMKKATGIRGRRSIGAESISEDHRD